MQGIEVTLKRNKHYNTENNEEYLVISGENNATPILVHFPEEYKEYSKRVDFKNVKNEKWTVGLYTPEDERKSYGKDFDKLNFVFTLPTPITIKGELQIQFIAYLNDELNTIVPFKLLKIIVEDSIMYVKKEASDNPDLIIQTYEYANLALALSRETADIVENLTVSDEEIDCEDHVKIEIQTAPNKRKNIHFKIPAPKKGTSYRFRGAWDKEVEYTNDQYFIDTVTLHGCTYFCKVTHTNIMPNPSVESDYWSVLAIKGSDAGVLIADNLETESADHVLSARQGKILKDITCNIVQENIDGTTNVINNIVLVEV